MAVVRSVVAARLGSARQEVLVPVAHYGSLRYKYKYVYEVCSTTSTRFPVVLLNFVGIGGDYYYYFVGAVQQVNN
jgi:hypothetical protein